MKVTYDMRGDKELIKKLSTLPDKIEKKVLRTAVRNVQKIMVPVAKANAASMVGGEMGGLISKNIQVRKARKQKRGCYTINVQLKGGIERFFEQTESGKRHYIPAAIEYGHISGGTYIEPIPFMRSAAEATVAERKRIFAEQLRAGLIREAIKGRSA